MFKIYTIYHETTFNDVSQKQVLSYIEQQRDSQQQWQHSRCYLGNSTNWHWGNIQQGKLSHWVHTASWQPSSPASAWQQKDSQQQYQLALGQHPAGQAVSLGPHCFLAAIFTSFCLATKGQSAAVAAQ